MHGARPQYLDGAQVLRGRVALVLPEAVAAISTVQTVHQPVASHLGNDAGGRDAGAARVSSDYGALRDAQFVESRQFNVTEIARFWGMPLYKLQEGKQAYNSNEQQALDYLGNPLDTILVQYEQEYRRKLLSRGEQKKRYFRFNRTALLRTDSTARGAFLKTMVDTGIYTRNEARAYEELNAYRTGDENPANRLFVSKNFASIENVDKTVGIPAVAVQ